jgi:hypothetical protein NreA
MDHGYAHPSHAKIVNRLKRAGGHLSNVVAMLEDGAPCLDVSQQLQAVERAITAAKKALIHEHLEHCLMGDSHLTLKHGDTVTTLDELKRITKYL